MDTPERSQNAGAPLSNFEDSPLFSFINSLSPIQPVKSLHSVQAYTSPGFTSISSVFSSPHVNLQKESRFLTRHPYSDSAKQENSLENGDESNLCAGVSNAVKLSSCIVVAQENCNTKCSFNVDRPDECSTLPCNLPHSAQYDCGRPNHSVRRCFGAKLDPKLDIGCTHVEVIQFVQDGLDKRKRLFAAEAVQEHHLTEQIKEEVPGCDWENLISDDTDDLLVFDDSTESEACEDQNEKLRGKDANSLTSFSLNLTEKFVDDSQKTQTDDSFGPCLQNSTQDPHVTHSGEIGEQNETDHTPQIVAGVSQRQVVMSNQSQNMGNGTSDCVSFGYKADSHKQRGIRRRCLVFEISGVSKRNSLMDSSLHPSDCLPSNRKFTSDNRHLASLKPGVSPSPCVLPGIGLHLNTLAAASKDRVATQETLASRRQLIGMPCSVDPFPLRTAKQKSLNRSLAVEKDLQPTGSEVQNLQIMHDDSSQTPELGSDDELSQSSPRKKRSKTEGRESESCKHCKCKKSKCLKLYCECFAAGVYCIEPCSCQGCHNKPIHEETVLTTRKQIEARNPLAFAPKVIHTSDNVQDMREAANKTPASARHKRGCNCKKSSCLKKYCECYQGGVGCSSNCRCEGCKNAFGRKDGVVPMGVEEIEPGEEEMDACEKESDEGQNNADIEKDECHFPENVLFTTPAQFCRMSVKPPFFSSGKPPRSFTLPIGKSPLLDTCQTLRKSEISPSNMESISRFGEHIKIVPEDDTPEILRGNASPSNCVKTASPNGKRVSPPHNGIGLSPSRKGGRKLILKSIPAFPSLSSDVTNEHPVNHSNSSINSSLLS